MKPFLRFYASVLTLAALSGCATQGKPPPVISLDEPVQAQLLPEPPAPVEVVAVPEVLPIPAQLKPLPEADEPKPESTDEKKKRAYPALMPKHGLHLPAKAMSTRFRSGRTATARYIKSTPPLVA